MSETINEVTGEVTESAIAAPTRPRKLEKSLEGNVVTINAIGGEKGAQTFDVTELPEAIQEAFKGFGLSHKLGDSAAGLSGVEAEAAIQKVWDGLKAGDWTVRAPALPKVKMADVKNALANMSPEDAEKARALMAQMGITI